MAMIAAGASELPAATPDALEPAWLEVTLNGQAVSEPALALLGPDGAVYLPAARLLEWRLRLPVETEEIDGVSYVPLTALAGVTVDIDHETQTISIRVEPSLLDSTGISYRTGTSEPMTRSGRGGFLNYDLVLDHVGGRESAGAAVELGAFLPGGSGTTTFVGRWSDGRTRLTRLETNWVIDDPARMRSIRLGDGISRGGMGGRPFRFGGVQFGRNFDVQPGFVTLPMPTLSGSAALPSVVDVYVNDVLQGRHEVQPGPFSVIDVPVITGSGEVQLVVRDLLGRETIVRESYYAAPQLLRSGLHDYSYEAGFVRQAYGRRSHDYGPLFLSGTHRYGFTDRLTGEAHVEVTADVQVAGVSAAVLLPEIGLLSAGVAGSQSEWGTGVAVSAGFERRTPKLSYGAVAEFLTEDFTYVGAAPDGSRRRTSIQAFAGVPLPVGSAGLSYTRRDGRGEGNVEIVSANASIHLGRMGTLNLVGRRTFGDREEIAVELRLSIPLGPRTHASAGARYRGGNVSGSGALQRNLPAGEGLGYRIAGLWGEFDRLDGRIDAQTGFGTYGAQLAWSEGDLGARLSASGAIGLVDGRGFASRRLLQSFAAVGVGDYPGVRVYADNQLVGTTGPDGVAMVPHLRGFEENRIRIELADLPMDAEVTLAERTVRPYGRTGVSVDFEVGRARSAILNVRLESGVPLPTGTRISIAGVDQDFFSAPGGDVYVSISHQQATYWLEADLGASTCNFEIVLPDTPDPQPRFGPFVCERKLS